VLSRDDMEHVSLTQCVVFVHATDTLLAIHTGMPLIAHAGKCPSVRCGPHSNITIASSVAAGRHAFRGAHLESRNRCCNAPCAKPETSETASNMPGASNHADNGPHLATYPRILGSM
jgi:hypothetical protein